MSEQGRQFALNVSGGFVAVSIMLILGFLTWALVYRQIPDGNEPTLIQVVGGLQALAGMIVGYYFGSSQGHKKATDALADTVSPPKIEVSPNATISTVSETKVEHAPDSP